MRINIINPKLKKDKGPFLIEYVSYGIANRFSGNRIEINKKLLQSQYKPIYYELIEHEKAHSDKSWCLDDFAMDLQGFENRWLYNKFILTTPSSWVQLSPIYLSKGKIYWDITLIIFWFIVIMILVIGIFYGTR